MPANNIVSLTFCAGQTHTIGHKDSYLLVDCIEVVEDEARLRATGPTDGVDLCAPDVPVQKLVVVEVVQTRNHRQSNGLDDVEANWLARVLEDFLLLQNVVTKAGGRRLHEKLHVRLIPHVVDVLEKVLMAQTYPTVRTVTKRQKTWQWSGGGNTVAKARQ